MEKFRFIFICFISVILLFSSCGKANVGNTESNGVNSHLQGKMSAAKARNQGADKNVHT